MAQRSDLLPKLYTAIALLALVTCWRQNLLFMQDEDINLAQAFVVFWPALLANHATTSITVDIFLFLLAAVVWMVVEARRLGLRLVWIYVVLGFAVAISVTFPLFLAARERALASKGESAVQVPLGDWVGLALVGVMTVAFAIWTFVVG